MAYGIDPALPKEINDWNSPEHWLRSDMQSALDHGQVDKAKVLADALQTTVLPGVQAGKDAAEVEKIRLGIKPGMEEQRQKLLPNPEGEQILRGATPAPTTDTSPDFISLLKGGWSLPGKSLLFK